MSDCRIAVIGGGIAGIEAALRLSAAGAEVTLLESRGRLGGAAFSFTRNGLVADNGQHVFLRCCTAYQEFLEELGATSLVTIQSRLTLPVLAPGGRSAALRRNGLPAPLHLAGSLARYRLLPLRERAAVARAMLALRGLDHEDPAVDGRRFGEWLRGHHQGRQAIEGVWDLILRPTLNMDPEGASLAQAAQVFQVGLLSDTAAGDVGYAHVPLSEIHDVAARRALSGAGVEVRLRRGVSAIIPGKDGFGIEVSGAPTMSAAIVVLAVPPDRAARLLPPGARIDKARLARLGRSPIVNLHVVYDRRVMELPFAAGVGSPVQWVFDRTHSSGLESGQYLAVSLSAAEEELTMSVEDLRDRYLPALAELFPAAAEAVVQSFFVTREHSATFRAAPGSRTLRPGPRTALPGLILAGSWTDTGWPATMESAVRSGRVAAEVALERLGDPVTRLVAAATRTGENGSPPNGAAGRAASNGSSRKLAAGRRR